MPFHGPNWPKRPRLTSGGSAWDLRSADLDGDGDPDLVVSRNAGGAVVLLGNGDGTFAAPTTLAVTGVSAQVAIADFDGNGRLDLVTPNLSGDNFSVFRALGAGAFAPAVNTTAGTQPAGVGVGDFNEDGLLDLAVSNFTSNNVSILLNDGGEIPVTVSEIEFD